MNVRADVVLGSRILAENGHSDMVWGHLSRRDPDGRGIWIKRSGLGFEELRDDDIQLVSWNSELLEGHGAIHLEHHIHLEVMRARPDVNAVVHSHPEAAIALAATGSPLLPISHEGSYFSPPDVPRFTQTGDLIRTPELGVAVAGTLGDSSALLLVNHGIVIAEADVRTAVFAAVLLEKACRIQLLAQAAVPGQQLLHSDAHEAAEKRARCYAPSQIEQGWAYLERRL